MGDRALVQFKNKDESSPVLYTHWYGNAVLRVIEETNVRQGYRQECPNVGRLLENLSFTLKMENDMMGAILDDGVDPVDVARDWLQKNPDMLDVWLEGVTTFSGEEAALDVVKASLFQ